MFLSLDAIPFAPCALPDLTITDPRKKGKDYIMQAGLGYLWAYAQSGSQDFYRGRDRYAELEDYANGDNAVRSALKKDEANKASEANGKIDFRPLPLLHKPLMSVEGLLKSHSYEATVTAVDPISRAEEDEYKAKMRAWMAHQEFLKSLGMSQPGGMGAEIPIDEDDLGWHMEVGYKAREAIAMEQKIAYGMYLADFARQDQQCTRDETVKGPSVLYMARRGVRRLPMRIDPGDAFIMPARAEDFPNLQAGAHIEPLSLGQVLAEINDDPDTTLGPEDIIRLKELARTRQTNSNASQGGQIVHMGGQAWIAGSLQDQAELAGQINVIRFSFVSTDLEVQKEYTNQFGNKQVRVMEASYGGPQEANPGRAKDMKVHRRTIQNWYEGTLILGTEMGYGCRKAYEQLRAEDNPFACLPLYIVNAPGLMGGKIKSMVERCRIAVDLASRAIVKMQHAEAKWPDLTVKFNQSALQEAATDGGPGGKTLTRSDVVKFWIQEGIVVGNKTDDQGNPIGDPLEFVETPLLQTMTRHWQTIERAKAEIADIAGINGAISGDDPVSRQGEGVTNLAIEGSQNALNHLFVAKHSRFERVARAIAASVKGSESRAPLAGSMTVAGKGGQQRTVYVAPAPDLPKREFQFKIEQKPTDQQWQDFYAYMKNFTLGPDPLLTPKDVADLWIVDNLKMARYLLAIRYKRAQLRRDQTAAINSENQGKQAQMATESAGTVATEAEKLRHQNKMEEINLTKGWEFRIAQHQASGHVEATAITQDARLQAQQFANQHGAAMQQLKEVATHERHDAALTSQEQESAAHRIHEAELQAAQPEPAAV